MGGDVMAAKDHLNSHQLVRPFKAPDRVELDSTPGTPQVENVPLYHGTASWIPSGEIIRPGERDAFYGSDHPIPALRQSGTYATTDKGVATKYSRNSWESAADRAVGSGGSYQVPLFTPVYEVEHVSEHHDPSAYFSKDHPWQPAIGQSTYRRDLQGFRVKGSPVGYHYPYTRPPDDPSLDM